MRAQTGCTPGAINVMAGGDKKQQRRNSTVSLGFSVVCGMSSQTQSRKVLKNEIVIMVTKSPVPTTRHLMHPPEITPEAALTTLTRF